MATSSTDPLKPVSILFVCLGNICRSTMAEAHFRSLISHHSTSKPQSHPLISKIDSCGTGAYHTGAGPDTRTLSILADNGITDYKHAARRVRVPQDFREFDYIVAMDGGNVEDLRGEVRRAKGRAVFDEGEAERAEGKVWLYGEFGRGQARGVKRGKTRSGRGGSGSIGGDEEAEEVQDPYYGGREGFTVAWEQLERFGRGLLAHIEEEARKGKEGGE